MSPNNLGDQPIEPRYKEIMRDLAHAIDKFLNGTFTPKQNGFILLVFPFNDTEGRCNYISNAERSDVILLLKEQLQRFENEGNKPN